MGGPYLAGLMANPSIWWPGGVDVWVGGGDFAPVNSLILTSSRGMVAGKPYGGSIFGWLGC